MSGLGDRLKQAEQAAAQVAELDAKRALAESLPSLQAEAEREQRTAQATAALEYARQQAREQFTAGPTATSMAATFDESTTIHSLEAL
jgi:hypothetical protein